MMKINKQKTANLVMGMIIGLIVLTGVLVTGHIRGWFDRSCENQACLTEIRGNIYLNRNHVSYPVSEETVLRAGDILSADPGATAVIRLGESKITIGEKAEAKLISPDPGNYSMEISAGELFACLKEAVALSFDSHELSASDAVISLSIRSNAQTLSVFAGTITAENQTAAEGQALDWTNGSLRIIPLSISSLNDFTITGLRRAGKEYTLCFSDADLNKLTADRSQALQELLNQTEKAETAPGAGESSPESSKESLPLEQTKSPFAESSETQKQTEAESILSKETSASSSNAAETQKPAGSTEAKGPSEPAEAQKPAGTEPQSDPPAETNAPEPESTDVQKPAETEPPKPARTCIISILCNTVLDHMDQLNPSKAGCVPSDGVILAPVTVEFSEGETVFDVLNRACQAAGIQLEYSFTPMYNSYYIEGINNLYEFDCSSQSGWMYKVNEWFPNYGCSAYTVSDGDVIVWCYTCEGYGADVGASVQ